MSLISGVELRLFPIVYTRPLSEGKDLSLVTEPLNSQSLILQGWPPHGVCPERNMATVGLAMAGQTEEEEESSGKLKTKERLSP